MRSNRTRAAVMVAVLIVSACTSPESGDRPPSTGGPAGALAVEIGDASEQDVAAAGSAPDGLGTDKATHDGSYGDLGAPACQPPSPFTDWHEGDGPDQGLVEVRATSSTIEVWGLLWATPPLPAGEEIKMVWRATGSGSLDATAIGPDLRADPTWGPNEHASSNFGRPGDEWGTAFVFPAGGCWMIEITRGADTGRVWLEVADSA